FPRPGAIPGLPSVALSSLQVQLAQVALTADMSVSELVFIGGTEARYGQTARATVTHLEVDFETTAFDSVSGDPWGVSLRHLGMGVTLESESDGEVPGGLITAVMDSLSLYFDAIGSAALDGTAAPAAWWRASGPVHLSNTASVSHEAGTYRGTFISDFVLPGAEELKSFLPAGFPHGRFGQIAGRLALEGSFTRPSLDLALDLDLDRTDWLNTGLLKVRLDTDIDELITTGLGAAQVYLDTLDIDLMGVELRAAGSLHDSAVDMSLHAAVNDTQLAALFRPQDVVDTEVALGLDILVAGTLQQPSLELSLDGGLDSPSAQVPRMSLQVTATSTGGELALTLAEGLSVAGVELDSLATQVQVVRADGDSLSGRFVFAATKGAERVAVGGRAWADSLGRSPQRRVALDSLVIVAAGQDLRLEKPTTLTMGPGRWDIDLTPTVFSGEAGQLSLGGRSAPEGLDLAGQLAVLLSEDLLNEIIPSEFWSDDGGRDFSLSANTELKGSREVPVLAGGLSARLIPHRDDPELGVDLEFALATDDTAGLLARLAFVAADSVILRGSLQVPGRIDPETGDWRHTAGRGARLIVPDQTLGLDHVNRMLPPEVSLAGDLAVGADVRVSLSGAVNDSAIATDGNDLAQGTGYVRTSGLKISLPNNSRMVVDLDLRMDGALADPTVGGRIEIKSGFFRIPEQPRNLHPLEGAPQLWALGAGDTLIEIPDSLRVFLVPPEQGPAPKTGGPAFFPNLDLQILMPGNLRVNGYGLNIELAGDLKIARGFDADGLPQSKIQGDVNALDGTLRFMNRVFKVERGRVRFVGSIPPDPELSLLLETDVSGTLVRILISGIASDPEVVLSSEPDYEKQDIMAVLLFGRPLNDLDNDQRGGVDNDSDPGQELRQNMAGLAMAFGTAGLQNSVSSTFGVDTV
ncbi:MAG: hypothetical protein DRQ59_15800, partial [Gammaproteobacteria bacterium]